MADPTGTLTSGGADSDRDTVLIHIDASQFRVPLRPWTGDELRRLPNPPVVPDRDLFLIRPSGQDDLLVSGSDVMNLEDGMHFFTVPVAIMAG
jgi:hypothetical protein